MKPRVLILTAGYGEGHNAAARALAAACDAAHGSGAAHQSDVFALAAPRLNAVTRRGYLTAINRTPRLWSAIYLWTDRSTILPRALFWLLRKETRLLETIIAREQPAAICSTYPVYSFLLEKLRLAGRLTVPHFNIVTDSISINSLWWRAGCAGWFLPNEDSVHPLRRAGVDATQLHVCGFPVTAFFSENADLLRPPDLATGAAPRVLYIINSGTRGAAETARRLLAETDWEITCAVGRDETLRAELTRFARHRVRPANILGWTDQIPRLLMTHHVVVSKAGGATTQEAIAARCPMVVNQIVPGQEEGNYELLRRHGAGALAETPDAVVATLRAAFADRGRGWRGWREALAPIARPDAARAIIGKVFELVNNAPEPVPVPLQPAPASAALVERATVV
jgi:processive 1,2-diacylglycerol beta-glucosyltransferase